MLMKRVKLEREMHMKTALRAMLAAAIATAAFAAPGVAETAGDGGKSTSSGSGEVAFTVVERDVEDLKAVLATIRSKKVVAARVRTPGTVTSLKAVEGEYVEQGQVLALVVDPKIALRIEASDAQIVALESRLENARLELNRTVELRKRGVAAESRYEQAKTAFDVAANELAAARSQRSVIQRQAEEGKVLAPSKGRILSVPVTEGSVVMGGESVATVAANEYLLRLEVPERHARFMKKGDMLKVGQRGLGPATEGNREGRIVQVYPEIQNGRVIADAEVAGLGNYFVGERTLVWISAGTRKSIVIPSALTTKRFGLDYVRVKTAGEPIEVVVQLGRDVTKGSGTPTVEVLSGLRPGDELLRP